MADIFISYSSADRERVRPLVSGLEEQGWSVWWDARITPGQGFDAEIQEALDAASCVLVVWSTDSISSEWVMTEANEGLERNILVPVCIDEVRPPLAFRRRQSLEIDNLASAKSVIVPAVRAVLAGTAKNGVSPRTHQPRPKPPGRVSLMLPVGLVLGLLIGSALMFFASRLDEPIQKPASSIRVPIELDGWQDWKTLTDPTPSMVISPDGETVVFVARDDEGIASLKVRRLGSLETLELAGTQGAEKPFFSPDGLWIGYVQDKLMKRKSLDGRTDAIVITALDQTLLGASWGANDLIYFGEGRSGIQSVSVVRGDKKVISELDASGSEQSHRLPHYIAGHQTLLFTIYKENEEYEVWALDVATKKRRYLFDGGTPAYADTGHIVYTKQEALWVIPYDAEAMAITGAARTVQSAVAGSSASSAYAIASSGTLIYMPQQLDDKSVLVLRDTDESTRVLNKEAAWLLSPTFSNDGKSVAVMISDASKRVSVWIFDIQTGASRLFASDASSPLWSPDDRSIVFMRKSVGLVRKKLTALEPAETLVPHSVSIFPFAWANDGKSLIYGAIENETGGALYVLNEGGEPRKIHDNPGGFSRVSSTGEWIAICNWPRGIFVAGYPEISPKYFGPKNGCVPRWGKDDTQIFYQQTDKLWVVETEITTGVSFGAKRKIADLFHFGGFPQYDVDRDGRVVFIAAAKEQKRSAVLLTNWLNSFE